MVIWVTCLGHLGNSIWIFGWQTLRRLGDNSEALHSEQLPLYGIGPVLISSSSAS